MVPQTERQRIPPLPPSLHVAVGEDGMSLSDVQEFYDRICRKYKVLSVKAYLVHNDNESIRLTGSASRKLDYEGLYIERPFRKIFLNANNFTIKTVYRMLFYHLRPRIKNGERLERSLEKFMSEEYL